MPECTRAEDLLVTLMETTEDALLTFTLEGTVETWSHGAEQLYGYSAEEMVGGQLARLLPVFEAAVRETLNGGEKLGASDRSETIERLHKNGSRISVIVKRAAIRGPDGKITGILERGRGLSRSEAEDATDTRGEAQLRMLIEQLPVMLWTTDRKLRITSNWGSGFLGSQIDAGALVGKTIFDYMQCQDPKATPIAEHYEALRGASVRFEFRQKNQVLDIQMEPLRGGAGEIIGCIGVGLDITERKKSEEQIRYQATHDALTSLANYREFMDTLEREVRRADRSQRSFALLLLDLDELKHINDRLGHLAGNRALQRLAAVMKQHCRATDLAARYGGDEFALLLIEADPGMAEHIAERIERCIRNDRGDPRLSVSIGTSVYPHEGRTTQELLEVADQRLYRRKKNVANRSVTAT
jgi:diguanylate cyclase (GGDEF)-like protein/PAS domain S-box-containing protein